VADWTMSANYESLQYVNSNANVRDLLARFVRGMGREGVRVLALTIDQYVYPGETYTTELGPTQIYVRRPADVPQQPQASKRDRSGDN